MVNINQQEKERARQLYLEQQKARMAQRLGEPLGAEKMKAGRTEAEEGKLISFAAQQAREKRKAEESVKGAAGAGGLAKGGLGAGGEGAAGAIEGVGEAVASKGTGELLKWSWTTLIPSFGLTSIYLNIHFILRYLMGNKFFCQFGEEWMPAAPVAGEAVGKKAEIVEIIALILLDLLVFFAILGILTMAGMMFYYQAHPLEALKLFGKEIYELFKSIF